MRSGLIAQKVGMSRVFADDGRMPVTVLKVDGVMSSGVDGRKTGITPSNSVSVPRR